MKHYLSSNIGRLRLIGFLEGVSLLILVFIAVPFKYILANPALVKTIGPIHGALFLFFVLGTLMAAIEYEWKFKETTWKVLLACVVPFGTFYIDSKILKNIPIESKSN